MKQLGLNSGGRALRTNNHKTHFESDMNVSLYVRDRDKEVQA